MTINKKVLLCAMVLKDMNNITLSQATGISKGQITNIRRGWNTTYETANKIADALGITFNMLINGEVTINE